MYGWPALERPLDRFWESIRINLAAAGISAPDHLDRTTPARVSWDRPDLVLGQTCGYPFRTHLRGRVALIGTPDYGLPGAPPGYYFSVIIARKGSSNQRGKVFDGCLAVNAFDSQSGWAAIYTHLASLDRPIIEAIETGSHRASATAVAEARADYAAIDAVSWRLMRRYLYDITRELQVIGQTIPTPGLPFITSQIHQRQAISHAVDKAIAMLGPKDRDTLGLLTLQQISEDAYLAVPTPPPWSNGGKLGNP